jgi:hypothetical protein
MTPHEERMLKSALWYRQHKEFSVIPVGQDKKPLIKWQQYQTEKPAIEQVNEWWSSKFKGANVGIVTGAISNLTVIDIDSNEGLDTIEQITPDGLITPTATTPSGGQHRYFKYYDGLGNAVRFITDCDIRSAGGYIIAPPSRNGRGNYSWINGLSIVNTHIQALPQEYIQAYTNNNRLYTIDSIRDANKTEQIITNHNTLFSDGTRDENLFHLANCLVKGGMPIAEIQQYLLFIASHCDPPFPEKEIFIKIQSAIKRAETQEKGLTQAVRDLIKEHEGNITITNALQWLTNHNNPQDRQKIQVIMGRLVKEGLLRKTGVRAGEYRIVKKDLVEENWKDAQVEKVNMILPLGLHEAVRIVPSSVITFAGATNSGKTAFAMSIAKLNCKETVHYFSSEIRRDAFKRRAAAHSDINDWNIRLYVGWNPNDLQDIIKPTELNIIDYLEPPDGDYAKMATKLADIQNALDTGIAVVCIQKKEGSTGAGGAYMMNKPHLYCMMDIVNYPVCRLKILKCKDTQDGYKNPSGLCVDYRIARNGVDITPYGKFMFERWDC